MKIQNLIVNHEHSSHFEELGGLSDFGKLSNRGRGAVGEIKILGVGVTGSIFSGGGAGCSFSLFTFLNNLRNWRNENVNF